MQHFGGGLTGLGGLGFCDLVQAGGARCTGEDVVDSDAIRSEFVGQGFGPIGHGAAHSIGYAQTVEGLLDGGGDDIDNPTSTRCPHARQHGLDQPLVAHEVLGKGGEVSLRVSSMGRPSWRPSGIVDEDVNGAMGDHRSNRLCDVFWQGEVCNGDGMPLSRKLLDRCFQSLRIPCKKGTTGAQFCQRFGRSQADSLGGPTYKGVFSCQVESHGRNLPPYLRHMMTGIQHLHGALRWVVLILMLLSIVKAFSGMSGGRSFGKGDYKRGLFTMISLHLQLVLGFVLYFGKGWASMLGNADAMGDAILRFFSLEHMVTMLIAVVLGTLGHSLSKRAEDDRIKFRRQAIWFTVSLVLILSSIPWPFRPGFEAYGWW